MSSKHIFIAAAALLLAVAPAGAADLVLRERVLPSGGLVRLGDVADITAADSQELQRLAALPLMPAPAPGTQGMVTAQGVRDLIAASGVDLSRLRFSGAIKIVIGDQPLAAPPRPTFVEPPEASPPPPARRPSTAFRSRQTPAPSRPAPRAVAPGRADQLTKSLNQQLSEYAQQQTGDPMMQALDPEVQPRHLRLLASAVGGVTVGAASPIVEGRNRFLVTFDSPSGAVRFPVFADVRPARPAVYAIRSVPRGMLVTRADVELRPLPLDARLRVNEVPLGGVEEVVGKEAATNLRAGALLTDANTLPPTLVRRGEEVSVIAGGGGIRVRLQARARANGRLGEIVVVETLTSRERISARVVGSRELAMLSAGVGAAEYLSSAAGRNLR